MTTSIEAVQWNAQDYAEHSQGQYSWGLSNVERLALGGTEWVLDIGSGDGKLTAEIACRVPGGRVLGVDNAADMVQFAQQRHMTEFSNLSFMLADAQALDLLPEFDVAFSNSTLHWIPDHPAVLREIYRALKPSSLIFLSMSGRGTAAVVLSAIDNLAELKPWSAWLAHVPVPWYFFGPEEYHVWLQDAGFISRRVDLVPRQMRQPGLAGLESWLRTACMPYTDRVPQDQRAVFVSRIAQYVIERCPAGVDGSVLLPMVNLEVEALKPIV
jgi:trans-aconitate methyltransferase